MSTQKGNTQKSRKPKHQNNTVFKNNRYDASAKLKLINSLQITGVCKHCKAKIEWKIKYKKYKPLTVPRRCNKCSEKTVKRAYYVLCTPCATAAEVCAMCNEKQPIVFQPEELGSQEQESQKSEMESELSMLSERERRTFLRKNLGELTAKRRERIQNDDVTDDDNEEDDVPSDDDDLDLHLNDSKSLPDDGLISSVQKLKTNDTLSKIVTDNDSSKTLKAEKGT
ncbi:hypothetical protein SNE40_012084 [Patella caerulea]|uniref:Uncharacterized protein n=1 Tax=Patella caerulea TaxID=87958 RepID=A0AAN8JTM5_PATCE